MAKKTSSKKGGGGKRRKPRFDGVAKFATLLSGIVAGYGTGLAANNAIEKVTDKEPHPGVEAAIGIVGGGTAGALPALSKSTRKLAPWGAAGGVLGGAARGVFKVIQKAVKGASGAGNVEDTLKRRRLAAARGAGNVEDTLRNRRDVAYQFGRN